jgi:hypothetical protein
MSARTSPEAGAAIFLVRYLSDNDRATLAEELFPTMTHQGTCPGCGWSGQWDPVDWKCGGCGRTQAGSEVLCPRCPSCVADDHENCQRPCGCAPCFEAWARGGRSGP